MAANGAAAAYSATAGSWQQGPGFIYDRLAEVVVSRSPVPLGGARVLDAGAGTGAASRAALATGVSRDEDSHLVGGPRRLVVAPQDVGQAIH